MTSVEGITLSVALLGAALGLLNTWAAIDASRVKLKVATGHAIPTGGVWDGVNMYISVTNLSTFPVTVSEAGLFYKGTTHRAVIFRPSLADNGPWPRRLEPRSSISVYSGMPDPQPGQRLRCAYAKTDCGVTRTATSPALKQLIRENGL